MKKFFVLGFISAFVAAALAACVLRPAENTAPLDLSLEGGTQGVDTAAGPAKDSDTAASDASEASSESTSVYESEAAAIEEPVPERELVGEYEIKRMEPFSEGRAWVAYVITKVIGAPDKDELGYALIDETGEILCTAPAMGTPVNGGYTASCADDELVVFDRDGNETFHFTNTPEDSFDVLYGAEDYLLVLEHVTGFTGNQFLLYQMDFSGNALTEKLDITDLKIVGTNGMDSNCTMDYLGENLFCLKGYGKCVYNGNTNALFLTKKVEYFSPFYEGKAIAIFGSFPSYPGSIKPADLVSEESYLTWEAEHKYVEEQNLDGRKCCGEGILYSYWNHTFYDYDLEPGFTVPDYGENVKVDEVYPFSGGYAAVLMTGADGYPYVVMIDKTGTPQFDPVCLGKAGKSYLFSDNCFYSNGRFFYPLSNVTEESGVGCITVDGQLKKYNMIDRVPCFADENYMYIEYYKYIDHAALLSTGGKLDTVRLYSAGGRKE